MRCLWYEALNDTPCRLILVRDPDRDEGFQLALLTTDSNSTASQLIERYAYRWSIEVCFHDAKHSSAPDRPATASSRLSSEPSRSPC